MAPIWRFELQIYYIPENMSILDVAFYSFDEKAYHELKILRFESYSEEWLDFILKCRTGNDRTDNLIDKGEAIRRLRYEKPNLQICFRTQEALDGYLHYEGSEQL